LFPCAAALDGCGSTCKLRTKLRVSWRLVRLLLLLLLVVMGRLC
jgi:hypothetical protein